MGVTIRNELTTTDDEIKKLKTNKRTNKNIQRFKFQ